MEQGDITGTIRSISARIYLSDEMIERVYKKSLKGGDLLKYIKECDDAYVWDYDEQVTDDEVEATIRAPKPVGTEVDEDALISVCEEYIRDIWQWDQTMCSLKKNIEEIRRGVFEITVAPY